MTCCLSNFTILVKFNLHCSFSWQETDIEIKGFEEDVQKYDDLLMHHMKEVTETRDISEVVSR